MALVAFEPDPCALLLVLHSTCSDSHMLLHQA